MTADAIKATADVIKALVPFGPIGLAIVGIVVIAWRPKGVGNWIIAVAIFAIAAVFVANRFLGTSDEVLWFDADARGDWGGWRHGFCCRDTFPQVGNHSAMRITSAISSPAGITVLMAALPE